MIVLNLFSIAIHRSLLVRSLSLNIIPLLSLIFIALPQLLSGQKITQSRIIASEAGFLVYGVQNENLRFDFFDPELNLKSSQTHDSPFRNPQPKKIEFLNDGYLFKYYFSRLTIDPYGNQKHHKNWFEKEEKLAYKELEKKDDFHWQPPFYGSKTFLDERLVLHRGDTELRVVVETKEGVKIAKISAFDISDSPLLMGDVRLEWEATIDAEKIRDYQWYDLGKDHLYLVTLELGTGSNSPKHLIHHIDFEKKQVTYRRELKLENGGFVSLSKLVLNPKGQLLAFAHYSDQPTPFDPISKSGNSFGFNNLGIDGSPMGWCIFQMDQNGTVRKVRKHPYEIHEVISCEKKPKPLSTNITRFRFMNFSGLHFAENGHLLLIGENLFVNRVIQRVETASSSRVVDRSYYRTYGFTYLSLDENLDITQEKFFENFYCEKDAKSGRAWYFPHNMQQTKLNELLMDSDALNEDGNLWIKYRIKDLILNEKDAVILFSRWEEKKAGEKLYRMFLTGPNAGKPEFIKETNPDNVYRWFLKSIDTAIEFESAKSSYTLGELSLSNPSR
ncbi:MAG: hypothetical protein ACFB10_03355 [Salibacteraceae bacterium]